MIFLGKSFCGGRNTLDPTCTNITNINFVSLENSIFDEIHISSDTSEFPSTKIKKEWDFSTIFHALFQGDLHAGNVKYSAGEISKIRIKRRKKGTYNWLSICDVLIEQAEDFEFDRYDITARGGKTEYDYGLFPVADNIEGNPNMNSIQSEFSGVFVMEKEKSFNTEMNLNLSTQKQRQTSVIHTFGNRYPYVVSNGENNSYAGNISGFFAPLKEDGCEFEFEKGSFYRADFDEFLKNGKPKLIKLEDGRIWLASIVDDVVSTGTDIVTTAFNFVEIGDCESSHHLYYNGLIDIDIEGGADGL